MRTFSEYETFFFCLEVVQGISGGGGLFNTFFFGSHDFFLVIAPTPPPPPNLPPQVAYPLCWIFFEF